MRIRFGIKHGRNIKWPARCLWCNEKLIEWQTYSKKSVYKRTYYVFWISIQSRIMTIKYPICRKHKTIAYILRPPIFLWISILIIYLLLMIIISILKLSSSERLINLSLIILIIPLYGYLYYLRHGLIIHWIGEDHFELSMPDGKYAEEFGLLNNCNNIKWNILMQD